MRMLLPESTIDISPVAVVTCTGMFIDVLRRDLFRLYRRLFWISKRSLYAFSILSYIAVMGYWVTPKFFKDFRSDLQIIESPSVEQMLKQLQESAHQAQTSTRAPDFMIGVPVTLYVNPMLSVAVTAKIEPSRPELYQLSAEPRIRIDNLILYTGIWIVITVAITLLNRVSELPQYRFMKGSVSAKGSDRVLRSRDMSAEKFLEADVSAALGRATDLFSRSTLMLVAGVIMAFIGVGVFYVSLPQFQPGDDRWTYLERGIRPTGMLIFVEGIAWFLLRQYRALIEDYKTFHRMYVKRANYLVALKILSVADVTPHQSFLVASMISEDLTGKLQAGETTENLEGVKIIEPNPVFTLFQSLIQGIQKK